MDIYVAGKTHDYPRVRAIQDEATALGHRITQDWTVAVERHGVDQEEEPPTDQQRCDYACKDRAGVLGADIVVALWHPDLKGTWWECGMAAAFNIPTYIVGVPPEMRHLVFLHLPNVILLDTDQQAVEMIKTLPVPVR